MNNPRFFIRHHDLCDFCSEVLQLAGVYEEDASKISTVIVDADLRGVRSHGTILLPHYFDRLMGGGINPHPKQQIIKETATSALIDGDNGMGHLAGLYSMEIAIKKAKEFGVSIVGVQHTNHYGAAAYYPMLAIQHNLVGFSTCNTRPSIAPIGGKTPVVGNNPMSFAIPADNEYPIILDIALSKVAFAKILLAFQRGEKIPLGWALTPEGEPSEDPSDVWPRGSLLPIGEHKGFGLAVVMDVLAGVLTGAEFGTNLKLADAPHISEHIGHLYLAIDMALFIPIEEVKRRVDILIRNIKYSELSTGVSKVYLPGEKSLETKELYLKNGIPFENGMKQYLDDLSSRVNIPINWEVQLRE